MWEIAPRTNQLNNNDNTDEETQREEKHTESVCVCVFYLQSDDNDDVNKSTTNILTSV